MPATGPASHGSFPDLTFTGRCDLPLERAVVPYLGVRERGLPGGRASDLGVGVVLNGPVSGHAEVLDLGSGEIRDGLMRPPLVLYGWIFTAPFRELMATVRESGGRERGGEAGPALQAALRGAASRILAQLGYAPLTRPVFLRAGFRDVAMDLDPHEGTAVRLALPGAGVARAHLDYDQGVLVMRTGHVVPPELLRDALVDAFPGHPLYQLLNPAGPGTSELRVHLGGLDSLSDLQREMRGVRRGLLHLLARFDPARYRAVVEATGAFGERDLLGIVREAGGRASTRPGVHERILLPRRRPVAGRVH